MKYIKIHNSFSGCSAVDSVLDLGSSGRKFESCQPDIIKSLKNGILKISHYKNGDAYYRENAFASKEHKCECCSENRKYILHVHHIDKNRLNNNLDNLKILCLNCHALHHTKKTNEGYIVDYDYLTDINTLNEIFNI